WPVITMRLRTSTGPSLIGSKSGRSSGGVAARASVVISRSHRPRARAATPKLCKGEGRGCADCALRGRAAGPRLGPGKALVLHGPEDLRVESVPEPGAPGPGEIRLRNRFAGICGSDLHEFRRPMLTTAEPHPLTGAMLPQIPGHEYSGEVLEVGEGV